MRVVGPGPLQSLGQEWVGCRSWGLEPPGLFPAVGRDALQGVGAGGSLLIRPPLSRVSTELCKDPGATIRKAPDRPNRWW
jgi:hypothetical protein